MDGHFIQRRLSLMLKVDDFKTSRLPTWCPGCGDYGIWTALKNALVELSLEPSGVAFVFDIGCNSNMYDSLKVTSFEGLHGRTIPVAEGIRMANNNLPVICITGDGGCLGEGGNHFIHAARRNFDITVIIHDNAVYGLTTGQTSPTAPKNFKTKSTPEGVIEYPINPLTLALSAEASFVARGFSGDIAGLTSLIKEAVLHKGFSVLDILQPCVTFNHEMTFQWYKERVYYLPKTYSPTDKTEAFKKALEFPKSHISLTTDKKIPLGVFYKERRPTYEEELPQIKNTSLVNQSIENIDVSDIIAEMS